MKKKKIKPNPACSLYKVTTITVEKRNRIKVLGRCRVCKTKLEAE